MISIATLIVATLTLILSAITALLVQTRWKADRDDTERRWEVDRVAARYEAALKRALSGDPTTASVGRAQIQGMLDRGELDDGDRASLQDAVNALMKDEPPGFTPGQDEAILEDERGDEQS